MRSYLLLASLPFFFFFSKKRKRAPSPAFFCRFRSSLSVFLCISFYATAAELLVVGGCDAESQEIAGDCQSLSSSTRTYDPVSVSTQACLFYTHINFSTTKKLKIGTIVSYIRQCKETDNNRNDKAILFQHAGFRGVNGAC